MVNVILVCVVAFAVLLIGRHVDSLDIVNKFSVGRKFEELYYSKFDASKDTGNVLLVKLRSLKHSAARGAVCLDGTVPGYHLHPGFGSGARSWLVHLEGGGWCSTITSCTFRTKTRVGSSKYMENLIPFTGILSNKSEENPDFYNWNRVKVRYCDGASFAGDGGNEGAHLEFRGQQIWRAVMEELKLEGMGEAKEALLSGCSAGGLASILHCDEFRELFDASTRVKCLADAGLFLNSVDVSGTRTLQKFFHDVVKLQGVGRNLPRICVEQMDPTLCFFPENLIASIKTPLFLLNTAYDSWQVLESLAPDSADPYGRWRECKLNYANCSANQLQFLQGFRSHMVNAVRKFSMSRQNGLFINSCFAHCQSERQDTWFSIDSPVLHNKPIARAVGEWYFDRAEIKYIDCRYPCDQTCHNLVFKHN